MVLQCFIFINSFQVLRFNHYKHQIETMFIIHVSSSFINKCQFHSYTSNSIITNKMSITWKITNFGNFDQVLTLVNTWLFCQLWPKPTHIFPKPNPTCFMLNLPFQSHDSLLLHEKASFLLQAMFFHMIMLCNHNLSHVHKAYISINKDQTMS